MLMATLEKQPETAATLQAAFGRMLARFREVQRANPELAPRPKPRRQRDFRKRRKP
jgi:DTW domain-containing protein